MADETKTTETQETKQEDTKVNEVKTYTEEEVTQLLNAKVQSETDKVRTEYSKKLKTAEDELNKYKPKEKSDGEIELENRLKVLEDKEKEVSKKEKLLNIENELKEQGLPSGLGKYLTGAEDVKTEISSLKEIFNNTIKNNAIDNSYKPTQHNSQKDSITKEQFLKMSYTDRVNLFKSNKDLYNRLSK
ncbi:capsid assembly scaffolding protein Gp46 family protein [Clostridium guangxiense]|uniref:capsid assembly scaffolding protein Gp46 family protein n=1 Tax=Clostridium guangxiense TaxID=1662055 RepID=UPI001E43A847|nr:DUF4355 domain-containing protein [Clostridium guangxiense]MCD2346244.1 DUF4355 domain-containing protein [Clostridium guangxiense]